MKTPQKFTVAFLLISLLLAGCGSSNSGPAAVIYETVSKPTLNPGDPIPAPTGEVVLTVDGKISQKNAGDKLELDMATLESMGLVKFDVTDPFDKTKKVFSGVLISQFLKVVGAAPEATSLHLVATDDYAVDYVMADNQKWPVLIATQLEGSPIPLDKGGPIILVFPFDDFAELDHSVYDSLWIWALTTITVK